MAVCIRAQTSGPTWLQGVIVVWPKPLAGDSDFFSAADVFYYTFPAAIEAGSMCTLVKPTVYFHVEVAVKPLITSTTAAICAPPHTMFTVLHCCTCGPGAVIAGCRWEWQRVLSGPPSAQPLSCTQTRK